MSTTQHQGGFLDLEGRRLGTVQIEHIVRRQPQLAWQCKCIRCGSTWVSTHVLLVNNAVTCPNRSCGRTAPVPTSDASFTRAFIQEKRPQPAPVAPQRPTFNVGADPEGVRAMLDAQRQRGR
jgi:hypothetical protein